MNIYTNLSHRLVAEIRELVQTGDTKNDRTPLRIALEISQVPQNFKVVRGSVYHFSPVKGFRFATNLPELGTRGLHSMDFTLRSCQGLDSLSVHRLRLVAFVNFIPGWSAIWRAWLPLYEYAKMEMERKRRNGVSIGAEWEAELSLDQIANPHHYYRNWTHEQIRCLALGNSVLRVGDEVPISSLLMCSTAIYPKHIWGPETTITQAGRPIVTAAMIPRFKLVGIDHVRMVYDDAPARRFARLRFEPRLDSGTLVNPDTMDMLLALDHPDVRVIETQTVDTPLVIVDQPAEAFV